MSPLGTDWKCDRLKDVSSINPESLPADTDPDYEFDYLEISNVNYYGIVDSNSIESLRYEDAPSRARRCVAKNCTLISSVRPNLQSVVFIDRPGLPLKDSGIESIGVIPAHWDVKQIRYACEVNYGITLQLEKGQSVGDGVRILTVSNITIDGKLDLDDEYYIDPAELTKADYLRRGDLLFNWRNGSQYHVGKTAFFDMEGEVAHVSFLLRIRCGHCMDPVFMRSYLGILKDAGFFSGAKDKVNKTFNSTELKRLRVVIPPMDEQKDVCAEIERRSKECNEVKASIESQIATLTAYRKSLIHECVTGQRRITQADVRRAGPPARIRYGGVGRLILGLHL